MEKAGPEHEVMTGKALGRSNKLLLGNSDASSRASPHIVCSQGHVTSISVDRAGVTKFIHGVHVNPAPQ